jgi:hypothetical protein
LLEGLHQFTNAIRFLTIATTGNAQDFGDLTHPKILVCFIVLHQLVAFLLVGRLQLLKKYVIDYVTILSTGNAIDFGDLTQADFLLPAPTVTEVSNKYYGGTDIRCRIQEHYDLIQTV